MLGDEGDGPSSFGEQWKSTNGDASSLCEGILRMRTVQVMIVWGLVWRLEAGRPGAPES